MASVAPNALIAPAPGQTPIDLSQLAHRRVIGFLGLFLPALLYVIAGLRPTSLTPWRHLDSLSAYYYSGAVAVLVGVLFALGLFLATYRGYTGDIADRVVGLIGGIAAIFVGLFPTDPPRGVSAPVWWTPPTGTVHYAAAITLFVSFILFSLWLFRRSNIPDPRERPLEKRIRNGVFLACGAVMVVSVTWAAFALHGDAPIFWPESFAVWAFAISWLVKGEVHRPFVDAMTRARAKAAA